MQVLVTGGSGYIGSHTTLKLLQAGVDVMVLDNLSNSVFEPLKRVSVLAGRDVHFINGDIRNFELLRSLFSSNVIDAVLHFAGLKAVSDSVSAPLNYYENNVVGSVNLLRAMSEGGVRKLVFSSSATVYGDTNKMPVSELNSKGGVTNPYGRSKSIVEDVLADLAISDTSWRVAILRYFNPAGAHESGCIGEYSRGVPTNLVPYVSQVAVGNLPEITIHGVDFPTSDGTGVRDYIHVEDLAEGHLCALSALDNIRGSNVWNLGTGRGYSVLEVIRAYEAEVGRSIPVKVAGRRAGDVAVCYADPSKAEKELGWKASRGLTEIVRDSWRWQSKNPHGYC